MAYLSKHTPGPWHWQGDSLTNRQFDVYAANPHRHICTVNNLPMNVLSTRDIGEANGNAVLIAAAPKMFGALCSISLIESDSTSSAAEKIAAAARIARDALRSAGVEG